MTPTTPTDTDRFFNAFLASLLWSETDGEVALYAKFTREDIHPNTLAGLRQQCEQFIATNLDDLALATQAVDYDWESAGHDFALSRNGHGAGYFDRGLAEVGERLQEAAQAAGSAEAYPGDDGKVYVCGLETFGLDRPTRSSSPRA